MHLPQNAFLLGSRPKAPSDLLRCRLLSQCGHANSNRIVPVAPLLVNLRSSSAAPSVPNRIYTISGAAWAGETDVAEIAVSTDGGRTWAEGEFVDPVRRHAWRRWKFDWLTPKERGQYTLLARARDVNGVFQPNEHDRHYGAYVINHPLPIEVFVDDSGGAQR
jgi:hypothetical protein